MALRILKKYLQEAALVHPCIAILLIHRLGWVPVGRTSLFIRVISSHRGDGLALLADVLNRLELDVPIWKEAQAVPTREHALARG